MKSIFRLSQTPAGNPLLSDELVEFHAARILLLLYFCGIKSRIEGLTKLAKLDFFVRYPDFFDKASAFLNKAENSSSQYIESSMIRHHYGPWDKRYYDVLAYLESRELIDIYTSTKSSRGYIFELTNSGKNIVDQLRSNQYYSDLIEQMNQVKKVFGSKSGSAIKKLIYEIFEDEVAHKPLGEVIE